MAAPKKIIPENVGVRIQQLSAQGDGYRKIAKAIATEFGPEHTYSHQFISNFLHAATPAYDVPLPAVTTNSHTEQFASTRPVPARQAPNVFVPDVYVTTQSYPPVSSNFFLPYPYPENPPPPSDSIEQVMLDLMREKGKAAIWHAYQPPMRQDPPATPPQQPQEPNSRFLSSEGWKTLEAFAEEQEEERKKRKEAAAVEKRSLQNAIDQIKKQMHMDSARRYSTSEASKDLNPVYNQDQTRTAITHTDTAAIPQPTPTTTKHNPPIVVAKPVTDGSQTLPPITTSNSKNSEVPTVTSSVVSSMGPGTGAVKDAKKSETETEVSSLQHSNIGAKTPEPATAVSSPDPSMSTVGFSTKPDADFKPIQSTQRSTANNANSTEHTPPRATEPIEKARFMSIQATRDAGLGAHNDDGSPATTLLAIAGFSLGALVLGWGIDYLTARSNPEPFVQVNSYSTQTFTPVRRYRRVRDPNSVVIF